MSRNNIQYRSILDFHNNSFKEDEFLPEQLIIRVGKACNFRCIFCNVAENESVLLKKPQIKQILAQTFYRIKYSNFSSWVANITISGWEPSIFQVETIFVLKYFTKYFKQRGVKATFEMQSNASNITPDFAKQLKKYGVYDVMISNHTHDPAEYECYIGVPYDVMWKKVHDGIKNLINAWVWVSFNSILSGINQRSFLDHMKYLISEYPEVLIYNIWFVQPHGMAQENFDKLFAQYEDVSYIYESVIAFLKSHNKKVHSHLVGLPLCHMNEWSSCMEYYHNKWIILRWPENQTLIQSINDDNKDFDSLCERCMVKWLCSGIWKEYIGKQRVNPIKYYQVFEQFDTKISQIYTPLKQSLRKYKSQYIQQIFLLQEDIAQEDFQKHIENIKSYQFHLISVCISNISYITIDTVSLFASTNIQILDFQIQNIDILELIYTYNLSVAVQFRIKLDVHIYVYTSDFDAIIKSSRYSFVGFHFVNQKDIPKWNNIFLVSITKKK